MQQDEEAHIDQSNVIAREDFTPFGSVMAGSEQANNTNGFGNRFTGHERDEQKYLSPLSNQGLDYMLARNYDPVLGRFLSVDPLADKYPTLSSYAYVANNPLIMIDPDGREIEVKNKGQRKKVLKMINSRAKGLFDFDNKGKLYVVKKEGADRFSSYYRDKLIEGINSKRTISILITDVAYYPEFNKKADGVTRDGTITPNTSGPNDRLDSDEVLGGVTDGFRGQDQLVQVDGKDYSHKVFDTEGNPIRDEGADVLMHELVGHAIPRVVGSDTGNAIENENKVRKEYKEKGQNGDSPLREASEDHSE